MAACSLLAALWCGKQAGHGLPLTPFSAALATPLPGAPHAGGWYDPQAAEGQGRFSMSPAGSPPAVVGHELLSDGCVAQGPGSGGWGRPLWAAPSEVVRIWGLEDSTPATQSPTIRSRNSVALHQAVRETRADVLNPENQASASGSGGIQPPLLLHSECEIRPAIAVGSDQRLSTLDLRCRWNC